MGIRPQLSAIGSFTHRHCLAALHPDLMSNNNISDCMQTCYSNSDLISYVIISQSLCECAWVGWCRMAWTNQSQAHRRGVSRGFLTPQDLSPSIPTKTISVNPGNPKVPIGTCPCIGSNWIVSMPFSRAQRPKIWLSCEKCKSKRQSNRLRSSNRQE